MTRDVTREKYDKRRVRRDAASRDQKRDQRRDARGDDTRDRRRLQERRDGRRYIVATRRVETRDERCDDERCDESHDERRGQSCYKRPVKGRDRKRD